MKPFEISREVYLRHYLVQKRSHVTEIPQTEFASGWMETSLSRPQRKYTSMCVIKITKPSVGSLQILFPPEGFEVVSRRQ
jgi:hypothetical protein